MTFSTIITSLRPSAESKCPIDMKHPLTILTIIMIIRYYRTVVHLFAWAFIYKPTPLPTIPTVTNKNVHVIIPTVEPENKDFIKCVDSCLAQEPAFITIVTSGPKVTVKAKEVLTGYLARRSNPVTIINIETGPMPNKRHQVTHVLDILAKDKRANKDIICVLVDDHVWWPSPKFLATLLAPFENEKVGFVGSNKEVQRERGETFADSFLNFIACLYLERHNFEITAANAIDGGVFVVSGRTCAIRASIVMNDKFREGFVNEHFFFGQCGPLNPDDDNYITRHVVRNNWDIKIQNSDDALIKTTLGTTGGYPKFRGQLLRWARSQWRSNACSVFNDRTVWRRQLWCVHAVFIASFYNFALAFDAVMLYLALQVRSQLLSNSLETDVSKRLSLAGSALPFVVGLIIILSKLVKTYPFFVRNPKDIRLFPAYVLFAWFHSFIKLWSLLTFHDHGWGGRNLDALVETPVADETTALISGAERRLTRDTPRVDSGVGLQPVTLERARMLFS